MDLTREEALKLHRQMWTDMQNDLGDCPGVEAREAYKAYWCRKHGFNNTKNYRGSAITALSNGPHRTESVFLHTWKMAPD